VSQVRPHGSSGGAAGRPVSLKLVRSRMSAAQQEVADSPRIAGILAAMADVPLHCLVEIPKGSRNKYEWDKELGGIKLDRFLFSSVHYPTDYGFIPQTCGEDGDPLDAMVLVSEPTFPGCLIEVKAIAVFRMADDRGQDDKVLCVPHEDPNWNYIESLDDVPNQLRVEIEHFFSIYKQPEGKEVEVDGWHGRDEADTIIAESRQRFSELSEDGSA
jgi:inorganic pyrophosphatase